MGNYRFKSDRGGIETNTGGGGRTTYFKFKSDRGGIETPDQPDDIER